MPAKPFPCIYCPKGKKLIDNGSIEARDKFLRCKCPAYNKYLDWLNTLGLDDQ